MNGIGQIIDAKVVDAGGDFVISSNDDFDVQIRRGRRPEHMGVESGASITAISGRLTMTSALHQPSVLVPALPISMALA